MQAAANRTAKSKSVFMADSPFDLAVHKVKLLATPVPKERKGRAGCGGWRAGLPQLVALQQVTTTTEGQRRPPPRRKRYHNDSTDCRIVDTLGAAWSGCIDLGSRSEAKSGQTGFHVTGTSAQTALSLKPELAENIDFFCLALAEEN